jgi:ribosomal-protein-alanine N-acetyltransferase
MSRIDLHEADKNKAEALWPAVKAAHVFRDRESYLAAWAAAPWRVRADSRSRGIIVEPWRCGLDILAIKGIWAPGRDIVAVLDGVRALARSHGFARVLSPLVIEEAASPYQRAGMREHARVVAWRLNARAAAAMDISHAPDDVVIRCATADDLGAVHTADETCFDRFWAYDRARIAEALAFERVVVAESGGGVIGYTLCTVERGVGTLGRLGVVPEARERGIGMALVGDAVSYMVSAGADAISLCTQEQNAASRSLYARFGFRELPGRLVLLLGDA